MSKLLNACKLSNCDAKLSISFIIYTIYRISQLVVLFISYQIALVPHMSKLLNACKLSNCDAKLSISFTICTI